MTNQDNSDLSKIEQVARKMHNFVDQINQDLQISTPSKLFGPSTFNRIISGAALGLVPYPFSQTIANAIEYERQITEIAVMANLPPSEVSDFAELEKSRAQNPT